MVNNLGASEPESSEYWKAWMRTASRYLACAQSTLDSYHECAYYLAKHAIECALKGVLKKNHVLTEDLKRGSRGHNIELLIQRIIEHGCLRPNFFNRERREGIRRVVYTDYADPDEPESERLVDIDWRGISISRYPIDGHSLDEVVSYDEVKEVVESCEKAVNEIRIALERST